jgi:transcriptional regulator with XRE-family HTH domain
MNDNKTLWLPDEGKVDCIVADNLRIARQRRGLTLAQVGDAVGSTFQSYQKIENRRSRVTAGRLCRIATLFGVAPGDLFPAREDYEHHPDHLSRRLYHLLGIASRLHDEDQQVLLDMAKRLAGVSETVGCP